MVKMISKLLKIIKEVCFYLLGNLCAVFVYERKYLMSRFFKNRHWGIGAVGWHWIVHDCMGRILFGVNKEVPFPVSPTIAVVNPKNIHFDVDDLNNFQGVGKYFQALGDGEIVIGKGSWIAPNVGIISTNHDINDPANHVAGRKVVLGEKCWIGMNSIILPGVELGPHTVVGAGSVVTKSFTEGYCVIAGNPAKKIKKI